nr:glycoside hydrolase family 31 protein [Ammoniphilus sp. YIM 78166]
MNHGLQFENKEANVQVRLYVLEEDIFRVVFLNDNQLELNKTWLVAPGMDDIAFEGRDRFDLSPFSLPPFEVESGNDQVSVATSKLKAVIDLNGFKVRWYANTDAGWTLVANDRKTQNYNFENSLGEGVFHYLERSLDEQYFGLGEKTGNVDKYGRRFRMLNVDPMGYDPETTDPLYKHIPFYITRNQKTELSFGLFYDNLSTAIFDMGSEMDNYHGYYRYYQAESGDLDYYMILGPKVNDVVKRFAWMTGKTILPPKWSIGYSGSTMTYTDAPNAQEQLSQFLRDCEEHDIPCDSFQLSSGYTSIGDKRYVFHWNKSKVPNPKKLADDFAEKGLKLCANIKPALLWDHPKFEELKEKNMFVLSRDKEGPEIAQFWDELGAYLDFTNPKTIEWWKSNVKEQLLSYGIESTWNDNNEFEIWDGEAKTHGFGEDLPIGLIRPLQPLLMMKASYEAQKEFDPDKRPYLISRSGCPGMQRYVQTWTGDNRTSWKTLKFNIRTGIGLSLSGIYNFGHDVGGFAGPAPDPELFIRWVQNGIFYPRFTIHSWNDDGTVNVPWMYPEATKYIRTLIKFRSKFTPYIYQLLYQAHKDNEPMVKPTFYDFESDPQTFEENDDFMLGDSLLVASVVKPGKYEREVYLPKHEAGWYDFHTEKWYEGGTNVTIPAPLDYTPLLVKGGSILPINDSDITFETKSADERGFMFYPHQQTGESQFSLYEDDGVSTAHEKGDFAIIHVTMKTSQTQIDVTLQKEGNFDLPYQQVRLYFPASEARKIVVNGTTLTPHSTNVYEWQVK